MLVLCRMQFTKQRMKFTNYRMQRKNSLTRRELTSGSTHKQFIPTQTPQARDGETHCSKLHASEKYTQMEDKLLTVHSYSGLTCCECNLFNDFFRDHFLPDIGQDILNGGRVQLVVRAVVFIIYYT